MNEKKWHPFDEETMAFPAKRRNAQITIGISTLLSPRFQLNLSLHEGGMVYFAKDPPSGWNCLGNPYIMNVDCLLSARYYLLH